ncbi:hypothetical protein LDO31_02965 [Luteimonas sp. XNQY3]|nr:hypothetical protein [Luteimonas sp. XNQY3]MCD9005208.1 hypothetical protein [Luteimonas sp. XNQY3]
MAERFTIYAGEPIATVLAGYEDNRSGRLNQVAADYTQMIVSLVPQFTAQQWQALADVLGDGALRDERGLRFAWASVADSKADGIGEKWGIDVNALAAVVRQLKLPQLIALREVLARYRNSEDGSHENPGDLLRACGADVTASGASIVESIRELELSDDEAQAIRAGADEARRG